MKSLNSAILTLGVILSLFWVQSPRSAFADDSVLAIPSTITLDNKNLVLNGTGLRKVTIFGVKVYRAALYLEKKSINPDEILDSPELKEVDLFFLHDASQKQVADAWRESLDKNCGKHCDELKPMVTQMLKLVTAEKPGDVIKFRIYPDHVGITSDGKSVDNIPGSVFARTLLMTWLGPNPPDSGIKEGMLGISQ